MSRGINYLLSTALRIEVGLTQAGLRWPIGGTGFVVARRSDQIAAPLEAVDTSK